MTTYDAANKLEAEAMICKASVNTINAGKLEKTLAWVFGTTPVKVFLPDGTAATMTNYKGRAYVLRLAREPEGDANA